MLLPNRRRVNVMKSITNGREIEKEVNAHRYRGGCPDLEGMAWYGTLPLHKQPNLGNLNGFNFSL